MRLALLLVLTTLAVGCGSRSETDGGTVGGTGGGVGGGSGGGGGMQDDGGMDAGTDAGVCTVPPGTPDGGSGASCTFNSDCPCSERCECDESTGCFCLTGPRGTGKSGIDSCDGGNQCESSLCVEGWGGFYCSGSCATAAECGPKLPLCTNVAFIGKICVRQPDGGA